MKNLLLTFLFSFSFLAIGTGQITFGAGVTYLNDIGLQARANVPVSNLTLIPKFNYYFADGVTSIAFDADLALDVATIADENPLYVFAGPKLWRVSFNGNSNSEIGLNLGAGTRFSNIYVEAGYTLLFCDNCDGEIGFSAGYMF